MFQFTPPGAHECNEQVEQTLMQAPRACLRHSMQLDPGVSLVLKDHLVEFHLVGKATNLIKLNLIY